MTIHWVGRSMSMTAIAALAIGVATNVGVAEARPLSLADAVGQEALNFIMIMACAPLATARRV